MVRSPIKGNRRRLFQLTTEGRVESNKRVFKRDNIIHESIAPGLQQKKQSISHRHHEGEYKLWNELSLPILEDLLKIENASDVFLWDLAIFRLISAVIIRRCCPCRMLECLVVLRGSCSSCTPEHRSVSTVQKRWCMLEVAFNLYKICVFGMMS